MTFNKAKHKNIIFDLGGVLLNLDYNLTTEAFRAIEPSFQSLDAVYSHSTNKQLFEEYETGAISSIEFREGIRTILNNSRLSDHEIDNAWNAMLLDLPFERIQLLEQLKRSHSIFLLSNSNEIHIDAYLKNLKITYGFNDLSHLFTKEYYSFQIHLRKPNIEVFQYVLNENQLDPAQTFFIDDSPYHIEGARKTGMDAYLLQKNESILDIFEMR